MTKKIFFSIVTAAVWLSSFAVVFADVEPVSSPVKQLVTGDGAPAVPLPFEAAANTGFVDKNARDRKDGWIDNGATQDMRTIRSGIVETAFGAFRIIDPAANGGKSCVVLGGGPRKYLPPRAEQPLPGVKMRTLGVLHASAWTPLTEIEIGTIEVTFDDGTLQLIPVVANRDVGNWRPPSHMANGFIGWRDFDDETEIGFYVSCFEISDKPVTKLSFESRGNAVWMILGIAGSTGKLAVNPNLKYTFTRNSDWREITMTRAVEPGSALDFSFQLDPPAGKYGFIKAIGENFEFEQTPGRPVRFYGANLTLRGNYMSRAEADELAERLGRIGYNAIRLHHYDRDLIAKNAASSLDIDPGQLDKLEYLIFALKKRGIYVTMDLYSSRDPVKGEFKDFPGIGPGREGKRDYKLGAMLAPELNANLKEFAKKLLTHRNPYTGMSLAEDPVLIGLCVLNENMIWSLHGACMADPEISNYFKAQFVAFCAKHGLRARGEGSAENLRRFLYETHRDYWNDMVKYLRELGVRAPLTELNHRQSSLAMGLREHFDYVDDHCYWDHPCYLNAKRGKPPIRLSNSSSLTPESAVYPYRNVAPSRLAGKPFTVTEFNFCYPNSTRAEGAPVFAAYAAFQGWSAIYRFDYTSGYPAAFEKSLNQSYFGIASDPVRLLGERLGTAFFVRGDIATGREFVPTKVKRADFAAPYTEQYPKASMHAAFYVRTGTVPGDKTTSPAGNYHVDAAYAATTSTGEITADFGSRTFRAVGSRSEALVLPENTGLTGRRLGARAVKGWSVVSLIDLPQKGRHLLLTLTDARSEGMEFATFEDQVVLALPRHAPLLGRRGVVDIDLALPGKAYQLYALDLDGRRLAEFKFTGKPGSWKFTADTFAVPGKVVYAWEIIGAEKF